MHRRRRRSWHMPVSDLDIHRSAHLWAQTHGENATAKAREIYLVDGYRIARGGYRCGPAG